MDTQLLEEIGLTRSEALVYLALSGLGPSTTGKIIEKSGVASSKIYQLLGKLEEKGLVSHAIRTGVKEFEAAPPERILLYLDEKEKRIKNEKHRAERLVALLKSRMILEKRAQEATIYRGMKGLKTAFYHCTEEMAPGGEILVMGVPSRSPKVNRFFVKWNRFHAKRKIRKRIIFDESARGDMQTLPENNSLTEIRFMPEGVLTPAAVNIFDDKIIIFASESGEEPLLIMIRSREIADSFRAQFELLWQQNVKTFYGVEGPRFVMNELMKYKGTPGNMAFGLSRDKLDRHVPKELSELIEAQQDGRVRPPRLIFTGKYVQNEISRVAKFRKLPAKFVTPFHYEIYGDKVAIFYWINPIITTVIQSKQVAESFRRHFEDMWKLAK